MDNVPPDELTLQAFMPLLHAKFHAVLPDERRAELELVEVESVRNSNRRTGPGLVQETFSLCFRGASGESLPQTTYVLEQESLGRFELFIVPIGQEDGCVRYQAVFNRLVAPE